MQVAKKTYAPIHGRSPPGGKAPRRKPCKSTMTEWTKHHTLLIYILAKDSLRPAREMIRYSAYSKMATRLGVPAHR